jgi:hypothetical protein
MNLKLLSSKLTTQFVLPKHCDEKEGRMKPSGMAQRHQLPKQDTTNRQWLMGVD